MGAPSFFRHQKDSGSWSIYNTENLFDVNWILEPSNITTIVRKKGQDKISRLVKVYKFLEKDYAKKAEKNENWKIDIHKEPGKSLEKFKKLFDIAQCQRFKNCTDPEMIISRKCSCDFSAKIATLKHDENGFTDLEYYTDQKFQRVM